MLEKRDYTGAMTILRFQKSTGKIDPLINQWLAYSAFHNGDFEVAKKVYNYTGLPLTSNVLSK